MKSIIFSSLCLTLCTMPLSACMSDTSQPPAQQDEQTPDGPRNGKGDVIGEHSESEIEWERSARVIQAAPRLPSTMQIGANDVCQSYIPTGVKTLHVATSDGFYPYLFDLQEEAGNKAPEDLDEKRIAGVPVEMASAVCSVLGLECTFHYTKWGSGCCNYDDDGDGVRETFRAPTYADSSMLGGVYEGIFDMSAGPHALTPQRAYLFPVSAPTYKTEGGPGIITLPGVTIEHLERSMTQGQEATGLKGLEIAVEPGSTHLAYINDRYPDAKAVELSGVDAQIKALLDGDVTAVYNGLSGLKGSDAFERGEVIIAVDAQGIPAEIHTTDPEGELFHYGPGLSFFYSPYMPVSLSRAIDCAIHSIQDTVDSEGRDIHDHLNELYPAQDTTFPLSRHSDEWFRSLSFTP